MIFAFLTLLSALSLAGVSGWFSIIGITSIYAGAPFHAIIMGIVLEAGKLVTTSWVYRNWNFSNWKLQAPLIFFTLILMLATSIGVFGFLSKAHLLQGTSTIDNSSKIERLEQQISREKSVITDNEKIITQLDNTINSYLGKDRTDRSLSVRRSQEPQRKQLRNDIAEAQKRIDGFSDEKFKLQSEVRKLQLDVGPIRYIAELIYGTEGNNDKNIESAVRLFTLLIVSTLDPLAIVLLVAANHTILRRQNEKEKENPIHSIPGTLDLPDAASDEAFGCAIASSPEDNIHRQTEVYVVPNTEISDKETEPPVSSQDFSWPEVKIGPISTIRSPNVSLVEDIENQSLKTDNNHLIREIIGYKAGPHFVPKKLHEKDNQDSASDEISKPSSKIRTEEIYSEGAERVLSEKGAQRNVENNDSEATNRLKILGWLKEFRNNG